MGYLLRFSQRQFRGVSTKFIQRSRISPRVSLKIYRRCCRGVSPGISLGIPLPLEGVPRFFFQEILLKLAQKISKDFFQNCYWSYSWESTRAPPRIPLVFCRSFSRDLLKGFHGTIFFREIFMRFFLVFLSNFLQEFQLNYFLNTLAEFLMKFHQRFLWKFLSVIF